MKSQQAFLWYIGSALLKFRNHISHIVYRTQYTRHLQCQ